VPKKPSHPIAETDLYQPIYDYLVEQGYTVRSEVHYCDIAAVRGDDLIIIELKRGFSITLLAQACERQKISDSVYVAIPRPSNKWKWMAQTKSVQGLLRRLQLGLMIVSPKPGKTPVEVIFHPTNGEYRKRKHVQRAVLTEIEKRSGDFNQGGSCRKKLVTAYRENAIFIACCLCDLGPLTPRKLRAFGTGKKTLSILSRNVYSWFEHIDKGLYGISSRGRAELELYPELTQYYRDLLEKQQGSNP